MSLHDNKPVKFIITWKGEVYGKSEVMAHTKEEAEAIATAGDDEDFQTIDTDTSWDIDSIEEEK